MANELESLLVRIEANTAQLRRELSVADGAVNNFANRTDRNLGRASKQFENFERQVAAKMRSLGAIVATAFGADKAFAAIKDVSAIQNYADIVGLTAQRYQELRGAAQLAGIAHQEFDNAMGRFAEQVGAARTRTGDLYEFLKISLPTIAEQLTRTKSVSDALALMGDTAQRLTRDEERAIFTKKAFGNVSFELTGFLSQTSTAMSAQAAKARELGLVLDKDAMEAAKRAEEQFNRLSAVLESRFKGALTVVLPYINDYVGAIEKMAKSATSNQALPHLVAAEPQKYALEDLLKTQKFYTEELKKIKAVVSGRAVPEGFMAWKHSAGLLRGELKGTAEDIERIGAAIEQRQRLGMFGAGLKNARNPATIGEWKTETKPANGLTLRPKPDYTGVDALRQLEMQRLQSAENTTQQIALQQEIEVENFRRMLENKQISDAQFAEARGKIAQITTNKIAAEFEKEREALASKIQPIMGVIEQSLSKPLEDAFNGGMKSAREYFVELAKGFTLALQQALIIKPIIESITKSVTTGGGYNFISSLFNMSGAKAAGGPVVGGNSYLVGERGPEIFTPGRSGAITPNSSLGGLMGGGSGGSIVYNIDARNSDVGVVDRITEALRRLETSRTPAPAAVAMQARRFPTRRG